MSLHLLHSRALRAGLAVVAVSGALLAVPAAPASAVPCIPIPGLPICLLPPNATTPPTITGTAQVGKTLTATAPVWDQANVTTSYQWLRNDVAIPGATGTTYTLTPEDFDEGIAVRATGAGSAGSGTSTSTEVVPVKGEAITASTAPAITGSAGVGLPLTVDPGTWGEPTPTFTYQWFRTRASGTGAEAIEGATTTTYTPVAADSGRRLAVQVVAERPGYEKGAAVSNVVAVPKAPSTTSLTLSARKIAASRKATAKVRVTTAVGAPTGRVVVYDGSRVLRTVTLGAGARGVVTVPLPKLAPGRHFISARYFGDTVRMGSISMAQVLTVTKR